MKVFLKRIAQIAFFCIVLYGGYRAYLAWWDTGAVQNLKARVQDAVQSSGKKAQQAISRETEEYSHGVVSEAEGATRRYVADKTADVLSYVGEKILSAASSLGGSGSAPVSVFFSSGGENTSSSQATPGDTVFVTPPPPATVATRPGAPLVFSMNREAAYTIDWGDGNEERGAVPEGKVVLVNHAWEQEGDFQIRVTFEGSAGVSTSFFPVRVYAR